MRMLWLLLLTDRVQSWRHRFDLYRWHDHFKREGLTTSLRFELRNILTPRVTLREPFRWPSEGVESAEPQRIRDLVEWEILLSTADVRAVLQNLVRDERWTAALPELLPDFTMLLRDVLDLMRELGGADEKKDDSPAYQPSISPHPQNRGLYD